MIGETDDSFRGEVPYQDVLCLREVKKSVNMRGDLLWRLECCATQPNEQPLPSM